jgi:peptidoglycan/LPS O-acetylase OafA/YrhL
MTQELIIENNTKRVIHLDGLRGIASFIVYVFHFVLAFLPSIIRNEKFGWFIDTPLSFFINGKFAVAIFFVLSGFVLSFPFFLNYNQDALVSAAFRRYFRLAIPVFVSSILCYLLLKFHFFQNMQVGRFYTRSTEYLSLLYNFEPNFLFMVQESLYEIFFIGLVDAYKNYNHVLWTIHYEFLGSFLVYSFLGIFGNWKKRWIIYPVLILIFYKTYFLAFVFGIILGDNFLLVAGKKRSSIVIWLIILSGFVIGGYSTRDIIGVYNSLTSLANGIEVNPEILFYSIGAGLLILGINSNKYIIEVLDSKIFQFLGKISFSVYLLHVPIMLSFDCFVFQLLKLWINNYIIIVLLTFIIGTSFLIGLSYLFYCYIDLKSVLFVKILYKKINK